MTKLRAFTVNEMLVVLLITSIVVGMGFSVLRLVHRQMSGIDRNYGRSTEINLLRQGLWVDFNQSDRVWYDARTRELRFAKGPEGARYVLAEDMIVKGRDTFRISIGKLSFFFGGSPRRDGEVDALDMSTDRESGSQRLFVSKSNAATSHLNEWTWDLNWNQR